MKRAINIFFILICGILTACNIDRTNDCPGISDCDMVYAGEMPLHPGSYGWLPKTPDTMTFKNDGGLTNTFVPSEQENPYRALEGPYSPAFVVEKVPTRCCTEIDRELWGSVVYQHYKGNNLPVYIVFGLMKNHPGGDIRGHAYDTIQDVLCISISRKVFYLPLKGDKVNLKDLKPNNHELMDTLTISGSLYEDVYHLYYHDTSTLYVVPNEVYYNKLHGIIAYRMNNQETWYRQ